MARACHRLPVPQQEDVERHGRELVGQLLDSVLKGRTRAVERVLEKGGECFHRSYFLPVIVVVPSCTHIHYVDADLQTEEGTEVERKLE